MPLLTRDDGLVQRDGKLIEVADNDEALACECCGVPCGCCRRGVRGAVVTIDGIESPGDPSACVGDQCEALNDTYDVPPRPLFACEGTATYIRDVCCNPETKPEFFECEITINWYLSDCRDNLDGTADVDVLVNAVHTGSPVGATIILQWSKTFTVPLTDGKIDCNGLGGLLSFDGSGGGFCDQSGAICTIEFY